MKQIIAFAGSNSKTSINKQLATYASSLVSGVKADVLDLNDFVVPMFSVDLERYMGGQPENAHKLFNRIQAADGIVLSLAENNGAYSAVFKNLFDWMSRIDVKVFTDKPMLLMATSPGARGGKVVLEMAKSHFSRHNTQIAGAFSLPSFNDNFSNGVITNSALNNELLDEVKKFQTLLL